MNGAAMNCRQDQVLHSQHRDSRGLRDARYHLQLNHPCEQNFLPHHSKAINSQSDNFLVDGSAEYFQRLQTFDTTLPASESIQDPRAQVRWTQMRKPIDLPVPKFENDENCVANPNSSHDNLDLDTRIDLLIKSKALAGMHPIFSELVSSEDDSDDSIIRRPKRVSLSNKRKSLSPVPTIVYENKDDDPDKPLSRPPSPFLSRATYLFWFNKAIEIKEQAKAQEQALLEKATKKLQDNLTSVKPNHDEKSVRENKSFFNCLLNEISKEMKEMIKQQFINEVLENTISNSLESWETEFVQQEQQKLLVGHNKSNPASMEQDKNISDDILVFGSSEKVVSDEMRSTAMDGIHSEHDEKLLNEGDNSCNQTNDKQQHYLNPNRCSTSIHLDTSNSVRIDRSVSKESLTSLTSVPLHINSTSENKDDKLILDEKKQDEDHSQDSSKANVEEIKADFPVSTHIKSNISLSQNQADSVSPQNLDTDHNSDSIDRGRQNLEETHNLEIVSDKSSPVIENSVIDDEECSSITTSVPSHDKQKVTGNHQSYSSNDIGRTVINQTLCQDTKKETVSTDNEVKVQEYSNPLYDDETIVTKPNCEDAMDPSK